MTVEEERAFFLDRQEAFLQSGDVLILWRDILPYLERVCRSCFKKLSNNHFLPDLDDLAEEAVDVLAKRYLKKTYRNGNPESMCRWVCYKIYYGDKERNLSAERDFVRKLNGRNRCRASLELT